MWGALGSKGHALERSLDMKEWSSLQPDELQENAFSLIGKEWLLITAKNGDKANTMTAAWGGIGILWGKPVAYIFIRPQRYTKEFVDASEHLSLSFLGDGYRQELGYLGKVSGRDEDKIAKSGLTLAEVDGIPCFEEARLVLLGRKLYRQELKPECFVDREQIPKWYQEKDYHTMYVMEIEKVLRG